MNFHYALVDDLVSREEFESLVGDKMEACGDMIDEVAASLMVVQSLGRHHVKIKDLSARTSLFSFFGKVLAKEGPREFVRGDNEKGLVATLVLGDETGHVRVTLWDEKAMAVSEIAAGEVFEVIGKHAKPFSRDITALALRPSPVEISCRDTTEDVNRDTLLLTECSIRFLMLHEERPYCRKDGSTGSMRGGLVTDGKKVFRFVCWEPGLISGITPMMSARLTGVTVRGMEPEREMVAGEASGIQVLEADEVPLPLVSLSSVVNEGSFSVRGRVDTLQPVRRFTRRDGTASWVRNCTLCEGNARLAIVLWGDTAVLPLLSGEEIMVWNGSSRLNRLGRRELSVGRNAGFTVVPVPVCEIRFSGTAISTPEGMVIDNGTERYLLASPLVHGLEYAIEGCVSGRRFVMQHATAVVPDIAGVRAGLESLASRCGGTVPGPLSHRTA
jgi:replication factor A1